MRKLLISITFLAAALSARAQLTPDGIMALLPNMPTQAEMIRYAKESCAPVSVHVEVTQPTLYDDFREALQAALEKASGSTDQNLEPSMNKKINEGKVAGTNRTESELAHMTESQREAYARSQAASQLSGMGLSVADIAKLQSGNVSRAEAEALAAKMVATQSGGVTMADVQAMQNMTDKQRKEYLEQSGLGESMGAKAAADKGKNTKKADEAALVQDLARYNRLLNELHERMEKKLADAVKAGQNMYNNTYKKKIDQWESVRSEAMREGAGWEKYDAADEGKVEAASRKLANAEHQQWLARCEFYEKFIPMWRNAIVEQMDMVRSQEMPLTQEKKMATNKLYELTKDVKYAVGDSYPVSAAIKYLEIPEILGDYDSYVME